MNIEPAIPPRIRNIKTSDERCHERGLWRLLAGSYASSTNEFICWKVYSLANGFSTPSWEEPPVQSSHPELAHNFLTRINRSIVHSTRSFPLDLNPNPGMFNWTLFVKGNNTAIRLVGKDAQAPARAIYWMGRSSEGSLLKTLNILLANS